MRRSEKGAGEAKFKVAVGPRKALLSAAEVPAMVDAAYDAAVTRSLYWPLALLLHFSDASQEKRRRRLIEDVTAEELSRYRSALTLRAYRAGQEDAPVMARIAAAENEDELRACEAVLQGEQEATIAGFGAPLQLDKSGVQPSGTQGLAPPPHHRWTAYSSDVGTQFEKVVVALLDESGTEVGKDSFYSEPYAHDSDGQAKQARKLQQDILRRLASTGAIASSVLQVVGVTAPAAGVVPPTTPFALEEGVHSTGSSSSRAISFSKGHRYAMMAQKPMKG
jgi:hypothetical protein